MKTQTPPKAKSRHLAASLETARGLHAAGCIDDRRLKEYEDLCLAETKAPKKAQSTKITLTLKPAVAAMFPTAKAASDALEGLFRLTHPPRSKAAG